jgi:hypothetical protein
MGLPDTRPCRSPWRIFSVSLRTVGWTCIGVLLCIATSVRSGVAVAPSALFSGAYRAEGVTNWPRPAPASWPRPAYHRWTIEGRLRYDEFGNHWPAGQGEYVHYRGRPHTMVGFPSGFPMPALSRWLLIEPGAKGGMQCSWAHETLTAKLPVVGTIGLGMAPLWPGFAVNTLFYAASAWGLWRMSFALHRRSRRRKGRCAWCGYDRAGLAAGAACPECGEAGTARSGRLDAEAAPPPPMEAPQTPSGRS